MIFLVPVRGGLRRTAAAAVLVLAPVALAACDNTAELSDPPETVGTEPPRTTTTDPYAIPAVIDVAYVNRVLAGLDAAVGDVVRLVVRTRTIPPEAVERLRALYATPNGLQLELDIFQEAARRGFSGFLPDPGNTVTTVTELITSRPACIFAKVNRNYSAVALSPKPELQTQWVALLPAPVGPKSPYNPTGWAFLYNGLERDLKAPSSDPCVGF